MADVTRDEFRELRDDLVERMSAGFTGVHSRLDVLNGRVGKGEVAIGETGVRLTNLERETFRAPGRRVDPEGRTERLLTRRDVQMVAIGGGGIVACWKFVEFIVTLLGLVQ